MKKYIFCFQKIIKEVDNIYVNKFSIANVYTCIKQIFNIKLYFTFLLYIFRYF